MSTRRSLIASAGLALSLLAAGVAADAVAAVEYATPRCSLPLSCLQFSPAVPTSADPIKVLAIASSGFPPGGASCITAINTWVAGQTVHVASKYAEPCRSVDLGQVIEVQASLRPLAAGTYAVEFTAEPDAGYGIYASVITETGSVKAAVLITGSLTVVPDGSMPLNFQGPWWNADEQGWGLNLAHQGDLIDLKWFTYDTNRRPRWFAMLASKARRGRPHTYSGDIVQLRGPPLNASPFAPAPTSAVVGTGMLSFADSGSGSFTYTVTGISQTKSIERRELNFGSQPKCTYSAVPELPAATNYTDLWWNPAESGWSISLAHQGTQIYATWYTYDTDGSPLWLDSWLSPGAAGTYTGPLWRYTGPAFYTVPYAPPSVVAETGSAMLTFANGNAGTWSYTIGATSGSKPITRFLLSAPAGTVCQQ